MKYFGTDGIRGVCGDGISEEMCFRAGLAAASLNDRWVVATDTRVSSVSYFDALASGIMRGGGVVYKVGIAPTPCVSFLCQRGKMGGIMISASHNPPHYNGLKFFDSDGYKISDEKSARIENLIDNARLGVSMGKAVDYSQGRGEYVDYLVSYGGDLKGKSVALDCAFGAASCVAKEVFVRCGAKVSIFADALDGRRINCGVGAVYPSFIQSLTKELGFAFDGDADRVAVVSKDIIDGDSVLYNLSRLLTPNGVVGTVMNNIALERALNAQSIPFLRTDVGDRHISALMRKSGFTLGGEQSGHYIISPCRTGDGLLAALTLCKTKEIARLELLPQKTTSVDVSKDGLASTRFVKAKSHCEELLCGKGRLVVRMSGTEEKIRIMVESEDEQLTERVTDYLVDALCR